VDALVDDSGMTSSAVLSALCELELKGMVRQMPGKQFVRALM
jgi:predicted Rossmann fold nucleotide-binding protein DprA/Smf involved in DNA uptake